MLIKLIFITFDDNTVVLSKHTTVPFCDRLFSRCKKGSYYWHVPDNCVLNLKYNVVPISFICLRRWNNDLFLVRA